jgi:hypothetical protein
MAISSYISIFEDWDLLRPALWSIDDFVDEIVVVDGAYDWMAPSIHSQNGDPSRSSEEVYDVLSSFGKKIKIVNGLWRNETHKRQAGYEACQGRHILRNDADEIVFWNPIKFEEFLGSGCAVGQMEMPIYVSPGQIRSSSPTAAIERQSFLFDRSQITAAQHLSYLWLVLPPEERETLDAVDNRLIFPDPIAFTAHLTHWRAPETSINRARFYVMNYIRSTGNLPWLKDFKYNETSGFGDLFKLIPPKVFDEILLGHAIVAGPPQVTNMILRPSGRPQLADRVFAMLYDNMISGLTRLNDDLCRRPRAIANGVQYLIDASTNRSLSKLENDGAIVLDFSEPIHNSQVVLTTLLPDATTKSEELSVEISNSRISFSVPRIDYSEVNPIRRTVAITARTKTPTISCEFWSEN